MKKLNLRFKIIICIILTLFIQKNYSQVLVGGMWHNEYIDKIEGSVKTEVSIFTSYDDYGAANSEVTIYMSTRLIPRQKVQTFSKASRYEYEKKGEQSGVLRYYGGNKLIEVGQVLWYNSNHFSYTITFSSVARKYIGRKFNIKRLKGHIPASSSNQPITASNPMTTGRLYCSGCQGHGFHDCQYCENGVSMANGFSCLQCGANGFIECRTPPCGARKHTLPLSQEKLKNVYYTYYKPYNHSYNVPLRYFYQVSPNGFYEFFYEYKNGSIEKITQ